MTDLVPPFSFPKEARSADLQSQYTREDLIRMTNESIDFVLAAIKDLPDSFVTFVPSDPGAKDDAAAAPDEVSIAWTLGHVVVHMTASGEERAALGSFLARGVPVEQRARYETHWTTVSTIQQLIDRLEESRRIRMAYFNAWPDKPNLELIQPERDVNAIGHTLGGLRHDADHFDQVLEIIRQAREAGV